VTTADVAPKLGTFGEAAIIYAGRPWFVLPCVPREKPPLTAQGFKDAINLTGLVLTKMDGDSRGGAAISIRSVTLNIPPALAVLEITSLMSTHSSPAAARCSKLRSVVPPPEINTAMGRGKG
jgi:hypothetical protein